MGSAFVHIALDDQSRLAYAEIHDDESAQTATAVLRRAVPWCAPRGVIVVRVPPDHCGCYRCRLGMTPTRTSTSNTNARGHTGHRPTGVLPPRPDLRMGVQTLLQLRESPL
jgi:hypothetical protein